MNLPSGVKTHQRMSCTKFSTGKKNVADLKACIEKGAANVATQDLTSEGLAGHIGTDELSFCCLIKIAGLHWIMSGHKLMQLNIGAFVGILEREYCIRS